LAVAAGAFGLAVRTSGSDAARPAPSTLIYAYEHGTGQPLWATDPNADPVLDADALDWAAERAGAPFTQTRDLSDFGYPAGMAPVTGAPLVDAPPPEVRVLTDSVDGTVRSVTLSVRSQLGAELLRFQRGPEGRTRIMSVNGGAIEDPSTLEWVEHYGEPDSLGVVLELRMPATEPIELHVIEHLLRPRELIGAIPFERPAELAPDVNAMSDRAVFRYSVAAYADPRHAFMPDGTTPDGPTSDVATPDDPGSDAEPADTLP
jgi:hypothetical protein